MFDAILHLSSIEVLLPHNTLFYFELMLESLFTFSALFIIKKDLTTEKMFVLTWKNIFFLFFLFRLKSHLQVLVN